MAAIPIPLDDGVALAMQQGFADGQAQIRMQNSRLSEGTGTVLELGRQAAEQNADLNSKAASQIQVLMATSAAKALMNSQGNEDNSALAAAILAQRSAGGQPQASANDAGVNSGGPATK